MSACRVHDYKLYSSIVGDLQMVSLIVSLSFQRWAQIILCANSVHSSFTTYKPYNLVESFSQVQFWLPLYSSISRSVCFFTRLLNLTSALPSVVFPRIFTIDSKRFFLILWLLSYYQKHLNLFANYRKVCCPDPVVVVTSPRVLSFFLCL